MNILVACEYSGRVRDAFIRKGHSAVSCDLLPTESPIDARHIIGDVRDFLRGYSTPMNAMLGLDAITWDMIIAFPPCTHLAASGARWWKDKQKEQAEALAFVQAIMDAPCPRIAIENPVGKISTAIRKPDQIIQPWQFGHGETKATCLWLKGLPPLEPTNIVEGREARIHRMSPGPDRAKMRSLTYQGIADAMAEQWG